MVDAFARCAVAFEPGDPPRQARLAFWDPEGEPLPGPVPRGAESGELTVVAAAADGVETRSVPVVRMPVGDAVPLLVRARRSLPGSSAHPAAAFWGAAALLALHLVARGRLLPGVSPGGFDAWRVGPLDAADVARIRAVVEAMPPQARAVPVPSRSPLELPDAEPLVRDFLDAVADALPRTPAAEHAVGGPLLAASEPQHVPELRGWADAMSAGLDSGLRVSLRLEMRSDTEYVGDPGDPGDRDGPSAQPALNAVVQLHSLADPTRVVDAAELWEGADRGFGPRAQLDAMLGVRRAARVWAPLDRLLAAAVPDELVLTDDEVGDLLSDGVDRLAAGGVEVHWPKELGRQLTARAVVGSTEAPPSDVRAFLGGDELLSFNWQLALGDDTLTEEEMDRLAETHRSVVRLRDQWMLVDPALVRKARERELKPLSGMDAIATALTGTAEVDGEHVTVSSSGWLDDLRDRLADPADAFAAGRSSVRQPDALAATLRDYQLRGLRWLEQMTSLGLGGCLADDMGLGKTIMLIALHLHRQQDPSTAGPTLVVCPASLLGNWEREIGRFAPGTAVRRFHGSTRTVDGVEEEVADGFVLTTYGTMRLDAELLGGVRWGLLVADEAQHVKNPASSSAKGLRRIPAGGRVALTGTPVENNLSELWAILDWTTPGLLGTLAEFRARWARPVEADNDQQVAERLSRLVRPFLLRRRKSDPGIAPELPPKTETDELVTLTQEQAGLYEAVVRETMAELSSARSDIARRGLVMKLLTGLKQICNHPAQYLREGRPRLDGRSGKLELLDELLETIVSEGGAALVFTQYVAMARLLERHLTDRGLPSQLLHGGTPVRRREEMVQRFQDAAPGEAPVFLLSLKAAGTGLNLTRADHVVHYDRWWNPAVEEQATDRAYRIGQTRPVQVHRLVAEGTVEDRIATMLESKRELADAVLGSGEAALTELSDAELADLVTLRRSR